MSQKRKKYHVFLSHNSVDKPWVNRLKDALEARGLKVWLDQYEIRPGDLFVDALEKGLESSRTVALIISPEAMQSGWVDEEYNRAIGLAQDKNEKIRLIPVILRTAKLPGFLSGRNWVDFTNETSFDESMEKLIWGITGKRPRNASSHPLTQQKPVESIGISEVPAEITPSQPSELIPEHPIQSEQAPVNVPSPHQDHSEHAPSHNILALAFAYHTEIQAKQNRLSDIAQLFSSDDIWSDESMRASDSLLEISKSVKRFRKFLDELEHSQLTETVIKLRYTLMTPVRTYDGLLDELVSDITAFSKICREATRDTMLRKERIQKKLASLKEQIDGVDIYVSYFKKKIASTPLAAQRPAGIGDAFGMKRQVSVPGQQAEESVDSMKLYNAMIGAYNLAEIKLLCTKLGIDYENISGETLGMKINDLIAYCKRHGKYQELINKVQEERPHLAEQIQSK